MNLLKKISSILTQAHKDAVRSVFEQIKKHVPDLTPREAEFEAKRLSNKAGQARSQMVSDARLASKGAKISSDEHNENMENAFVDITALYKETSQLNGIQQSQQTTLDSDYNKSRAAILKLINDARVYSILTNNPEYDDIKVIDFNIESNRTSLSPAARVDPETRLLKLPELLKRRNHLRRRGLSATVTEIEFVSDGERGQIGKSFPIGNAVDSKTETFWAEIIYKDVPSTVDYTLNAPDSDGKIVKTVHGPIAKYRLKFTTAEAINQIKILPFSNFPVRVLEITYKSSASSDVRRTIKGFTEDESLDWMEFNFEAIFATEVEIVFAQESWRNFTVKVPKNILYSTDFMLQLAESRGEDFSTNLPVLSDLDLGGNSAIYQEAIKDLSSLIVDKELDKAPTTEVDLAGKTIMSIGEAMAAFNPELQGLLEEASAYTEALPKDLASDIADINKVEYVIGAREIQCNFITYSPIAYYSSEKLQPKSTVTNVEIEVDEIHPEFDTAYGSSRRTSTEWSVEISEDRSIPIYPRNHKKDGLYPVDGEFLDIDNNTRTGVTRFPSKFSFATIRENDAIMVAGQDYHITWNDDFDGKLQIALTGSSYDARKLYTIDYYAKDEAASIDILDKFSAKGLPAPDAFEKTGPDNEVSLSYFPFISYSIINSDDFDFNSDSNSYQYTAPTGAYSTGYAIIHPNWIKEDGATIPGLTGIATITGFATGDVDANPVLWTGLDTTYLTDPYRWYLKITDVPGAIYEVNSFSSASGLTLAEVPTLYTGLVGEEIASGYFSGNVTGQTTGDLTGYITVPYSLEVVYKDGEQIWGFDNVLYTPIDILVGGVSAKNITDYKNLEQPAFTISDSEDGEYEFIHDGRTIYFNQPIQNAEILADYRWLTKYMRVNSLLRANKVVNPTITPQVDEYRLFMNTTIL